ncbi:SAM-dependent methyltransferase [Pseudoalteromonas sp. NBT06-2]|uniref:class I SAM-dependent methyltransferase n=1 Tax=Pseudoalteromonas sp. NBT06-2 TaxID=2025950 RepID=UPI000BA57DC6|nr:class I SAM-dependent methyltransferase [Pseudoalteromonas sp. NBT06-2]PAJ73346.1 SAM-dependent methyltransferase [Pseudoalteromonas sp. NBT06-2]
MADLNNTYYNLNAQAFSDSTFTVDMQPIYDKFLPLIPVGGHILDGGCGSARDAKAFKDQGFKVTAIDASEELVKIATQYLGQPVLHKNFKQIKDINTFDGIWCCASLLHVPLNELPAVFTKLSTALKQKGVLYVSFKYGEPQTIPREHNGRLFTDLNEQSLNTLLAKQQNLQLNKTWITGDRRAEREGEQWLNAIVVKKYEKSNSTQEQADLQNYNKANH